MKSVKFYVDLVFDCRRSKHELVQEMMFVNTCVKFRDNRISNKKKSVKFDVDLVFDCTRSKPSSYTMMMFLNMCVKFRDNRIRKEEEEEEEEEKKKTVKSVKFDVDLVFEHRSKCELVQETMFVNTCVKFRDNRI